MSAVADVRKWLRVLQKKHPQLEVTFTGTSHYRIRNPANGGSFTLPHSPSDYRWQRHARHWLRVRLEIEG